MVSSHLAISWNFVFPGLCSGPIIIVMTQNVLLVKLNHTVFSKTALLNFQIGCLKKLKLNDDKTEYIVLGSGAQMSKTDSKSITVGGQDIKSITVVEI